MVLPRDGEPTLPCEYGGETDFHLKYGRGKSYQFIQKSFRTASEFADEAEEHLSAGPRATQYPLVNQQAP